MKNNLSRYILGADIGGSHITAAVVDVGNKMLLKDTYVREHLNTNGSVDEIIRDWTEVVKKSIALAGVQVAKIGFALPGPFDYKNGISYIKDQGKYDNLCGLNVKEKLANALNLSLNNIVFDNDAACFLRGEIFSGNAKDGVNLLGLTLGTGLGSVVSANGTVKDAALWCSTFKDGIAEDYLSTRWFLKRYQELTGEKAKDVRHICEIAPQETLEVIFNEFCDNLADFLSVQIDKYLPEEIIIGGNITKASRHFLVKLSKQISIPIKIAVLGENSALLGAASRSLNLNH